MVASLPGSVSRPPVIPASSRGPLGSVRPSPPLAFQPAEVAAACGCSSGQQTGTSCPTSWDIRLEIKCTMNVVLLNQPQPSPPILGMWNNHLPHNRCLVPKKLEAMALPDLWVLSPVQPTLSNQFSLLQIRKFICFATLPLTIVI